jgi:hypothetical protein
MKTKPVYIILFAVLFLLLNSLSAKSITSEQLEIMVSKQTGVDKSQILLFDVDYTDYGDLLTTEIEITYSQIKGAYKKLVFDCEDIALYIKSHVSYNLSKRIEKKAVPIGIACLEVGEEEFHAVNIFVIKNRVYIFDGQTNNIYTIEEYLKADVRFFLIII